MRLTQSLTLPAELERARSAGDLIIFAGAGVSMGPPANMPSFKELAQNIVGDVIPWNDSFEDHLDKYLGDAFRQHRVSVHVRSREQLNPAGRSHTSLHEHLIGLFERPESVRLITTNFEPFFDDATNVVFPGTLGASAIRHWPRNWSCCGALRLGAVRRPECGPQGFCPQC